MKKLLGSFFSLLKNTISYIIKGVVLVLLSYTFKFLTKWAVGAFLEIFLQFIIMSVGLFLLDNFLHLVLPSKIAAPPEKKCPECPECPESDKCECICNCEYPSTPSVSVTAPVTPSPANGVVNLESFSNF